MIDPALCALLVVFGILTGTVAGLLGIGGGILIVPFLALGAGLSQHAAEGTSLLVILPTAIVGTLALRRHGIADLRYGLAVGCFGAVGSVAGAVTALALPAHLLRAAFALLLALVGLRLLGDALLPQERMSG